MDKNKFSQLLSQPLNTLPNTKSGSKLAYVFKEKSLNLSFSRLQALWRCPREFYLKELEAKPDGFSGNLHTAYGSAWGAAIQELFRTQCLERALVIALIEWDYHTWDDEWKKIRNKSFGECIQSIETFYHTQLPNLLKDWELAYINGVPGIELTFFIEISPEFNYQGHIDLVLRNKHDGTLCAWEMKTSSRVQQEANWGNSEQTLGYHAVLSYAKESEDKSTTRTIYIVNQVNKLDDRNANYGFSYFPFELNETANIDFVNQLLLDANSIKMFEEANFWPKRGSNCVRFGSVCPYYGQCDVHTDKKIEDLVSASENFDRLPIEEVDFVIKLEDILK